MPTNRSPGGGAMTNFLRKLVATAAVAVVTLGALATAPTVDASGGPGDWPHVQIIKDKG